MKASHVPNGRMPACVCRMADRDGHPRCEVGVYLVMALGRPLVHVAVGRASMRKLRRIAGWTAAIVVSSTLLAVAGPAAADAGTVLYGHHNAGAGCSATGTGSQAAPFCTIAAAIAVVSAGQTVNVSGSYAEQL